MATRKIVQIADPPMQTYSTITYIRKPSFKEESVKSISWSPILETVIEPIIKKPLVDVIVQHSDLVGSYIPSVRQSSTEPSLNRNLAPLSEASFVYSGIVDTHLNDPSYQFTQTGSILPVQTFASVNEPLYVPINEGGGFVSSFSTIHVADGNFSTIVVGTISGSVANISSGFFNYISSGVIGCSSIYTNYISSGLAELNDITTSTIFAYEVFIDNQGLTANANELLLNGIPIATTSNISSLTDWSLDPAISTIQCAGQDINGCKNIYASNGYYQTLNTSSISGNVGSFSTISSLSGTFSSIYTNVLNVETVIAQSTIQVFSTITTVELDVDLISSGVVGCSTISGSYGGFNLISSGVVGCSTLNTDLISSGVIGFSTINGPFGSISSLITDRISTNGLYTSSINLGSTNVGVLTVDNTGLLTYNGATVQTGAGNIGLWSSYPALTTINANSNSISSITNLKATGAVDAGLLISRGNASITNDLNMGIGSSGGTINQGFATGQSNIFENPVKIGKTNALNSYTGGLEVLGPCQISGGQLGKISLGTAEVLGVNSTRIDIFPTVMTLVSPAAFSLDAGGAGNIACGGALSLAGGGYIEMNTGNTRFINTSSGESSLTVNSISGNSNSGGSGNVYLQNVSTINGIPVSALQNVSSFNTASISSLSVSTINGFPYTPGNTTIGLDLYLDTAGGTSPQTGALLAIPNAGTQTTIASGNQTNATVLLASFISAVGAVQNASILQGFWSLGIYTTPATTTGVSMYYSAYYVDADGVSNKTPISLGSPAEAVVILPGVQTLTNIDLFVSAQTLPNTTKRIQIDVYGIFVGGGKNVTMEFRDSTISHLHTTIINIPTNATFNNLTVSSLTAQTATISSLTVQSIETATFINSLNGNYSTLTVSSLTVPYIETSVVDKVSSLTVSTINGSRFLPFTGGQWWKNANQNIQGNSTIMTFQNKQPWTETQFFSTTNTAISSFTCVSSCTAQVTFAINVQPGNAAFTNLLRQSFMWVNRGVSTLAVMGQGSSIPTASGFNQTFTGMFEFITGDKFWFNHQQVPTVGTASTIAISANTYDLGTRWSYQVLRY